MKSGVEGIGVGSNPGMGGIITRCCYLHPLSPAQPHVQRCGRAGVPIKLCCPYKINTL